VQETDREYTSSGSFEGTRNLREDGVACPGSEGADSTAGGMDEDVVENVATHVLSKPPPESRRVSPGNTGEDAQVIIGSL
jgi:hypothetical protein